MISQGRAWQLQEAKNRLSEVIRRARSEGPQAITVRGQLAAVLLSADEYDALLPDDSTPGSWVDELLALPGRGDFTDEEIDRLFARIEGPEREVPDFSEE